MILDCKCNDAVKFLKLEKTQKQLLKNLPGPIHRRSPSSVSDRSGVCGPIPASPIFLHNPPEKTMKYLKVWPTSLSFVHFPFYMFADV